MKRITINQSQPWGMPHVGARYIGATKRWAPDEEAVCAVCGRLATNAHHEPQRGTCGVSTLVTDYGRWTLQPALIALCGSGTTGCHGLRHSGRLSFRWVWDNEQAREDWFSGFLLASGFMPHDERLFTLGHWEAVDEQGNSAYLMGGEPMAARAKPPYTNG